MINWDDYKNFTEDEFKCHCGCGEAPMDQAFMGNLQVIRNVAGFPLKINSGYRCPTYNAKVSSSTGLTGPHTTGHAADIGVDRQEAHKVLQIAMAVGMMGIGLQQKGDGRFIHLDDLEVGLRPTVWTY